MRSPVIRLFGYGGNPPIIDIVIKIEATNLSAQCRQHAGAPSSSCSSWSATVMMMMMMRIIVIAGVSMGLAACSSSCGPKKERRTGYAHLKALGRPLAPLTFRRRCKPRHRSPGFFSRATVDVTVTFFNGRKELQAKFVLLLISWTHSFLAGLSGFSGAEL